MMVFRTQLIVTFFPQINDGVSTSGSWPALGEMSQKAKKEGDRSPSEKIPGVALLSGIEQSVTEGTPASSVAAPSSAVQERPPLEKKGSGGENLSPGELLDLEQKLAGKKKGQCCCGRVSSEGLEECQFSRSTHCSPVIGPQ